MITRGLQIIFATLLCGLASAIAEPLQTGSAYNFSFRDVDGDDLAIADGHVTIITVVTREEEEKAKAVADLVPDRYIGDPKYRYITLVNFQGKLPSPLRGLTSGIIRRRLDREAKVLQPQYEAKKLAHNPRRDLFVVPDFDGSAIARLGLAPEASGVIVFVFDGRGKLVARWEGVPPNEALPKALAGAAL